MSVPSDIRPIVKRLLAGEMRIDHMKRLFEWLRFKIGGSAPSVKDVADFTAHRDERDQGMTWQLGKDLHWFLLRKTGQLESTKEAISNQLQATLRLMGPEVIKKLTGLSHQVFQKNLRSAADKIASFDGKTASFSSALTWEEASAFDFINNVTGYQNRFTQEQLMTELTKCLLSQNILRPTERERLAERAEFIAIFAVMQMHLSTIIVNNDHLATLEANTSSNKPGKIVVSAVFPLGSQARMSFELFTTTCDSRTWCSDLLIPTAVGQFGTTNIEGMGNWSTALDFENGKLIPFV